MSTVSMGRNVRPVPPPPEDATGHTLTSFRERIAIRSEEYSRAYPRAAETEARILFAMHGEINGAAVHLRGLRSPQGFRDQLMGAKNVHLADLCRLACEPTREARAAVKVVAQVLAAAVGMRLEPMAVEYDAHEALTGMMQSGAAFAVSGVDALRDGVLDSAEARDLRPRLEEVKAVVARWDGILSAAEEKGGTE